MITVPIEDVDGLLNAIEAFFGPDIFAPMTTSEPKTAALNKFGGNLKRIIDMKRDNDKAAKDIYAAVDGVLREEEIQDFLDEEVHSSSDREGSDVNNSGPEEQILFLVEELGAAEVRRLLNSAFEGRLSF